MAISPHDGAEHLVDTAIRIADHVGRDSSGNNMEAHHGWNRFIVTDMTGRLFVMGLPAGSVQERHSAKTALVSIRLGAPIRFVC